MEIDYFKDFIILVSAVVYNERAEVLLIRRNENHKSFKDFWQLPEGKMEFGEQAQETLRRELKKEVGMRLISANILMTNSKVISFADKRFHLLRIVLETKCEGEVTLGHEHSAHQWMSFRRALNLRQLTPGLKEVLLEFKDRPQKHPEALKQ